MWLKKLVLVATFICLAFAFSLTAYAMPEEEEDGFFKTFPISQEELQSNVVDDNLGLYFVSKEGSSTIQPDDTEINDYKILNLNKGFSKLSLVTFASSKMFSGKGEEKTTVGVMVFNIKDKAIVPSSRSVITIGASGVYNASIVLKNGDNNVIFIVKKDDLMLYRLFKVTVKEEETKDKLENIQVNFIPNKGITDQKPSGIPGTIYNVPGITAK